MRKILNLLAVALIAIVSGQKSSAQSLVVNSRIDSTTIVMGDRTRLHIEVLTDSKTGGPVNFPEINPGQVNEYYDVEFIECDIDSTSLGNGRTQISYNYLIQAFNPGVITIPEFAYTAEGDTVKSDIITMRVNPVILPEEFGDIENMSPDSLIYLKYNPSERVMNIKKKWYDVLLPGFLVDNWVWIVLGMALAALIIIIVYLYRKNGKTLIALRKPQLPPYELAMLRFEELRQKRLDEQGHEKQYYTELTEILRQYIQGRFGINALELTTTQIIQQLRKQISDIKVTNKLKDVLSNADFVKFAKLRPTTEENKQAFRFSREFVEETKPLPEPSAAEKDTTSTPEAVSLQSSDNATEHGPNKE